MPLLGDSRGFAYRVMAPKVQIKLLCIALTLAVVGRPSAGCVVGVAGEWLVCCFFLFAFAWMEIGGDPRRTAAKSTENKTSKET